MVSSMISLERRSLKKIVSEKLLSDNSLSISEALETDVASWLSS